MKTKRSRLIVVLLILSLLVSCASSQEEGNTVGEFVTVVDSVGREVTIEQPVETLACFYHLGGQLVTMLNRDVEITGVIRGLKRDLFLKSINPDIEKAVDVGGGRQANIEALVELDPDLVIISTKMWQNPKEVKKLDGTGLTYLVLDYTSIEGQMEIIDYLGKVLDAEEKAEAYNNYYKDRIELVEDRIKDLSEDERLTVFYSNGDPTKTEPKNTIAREWIKKVGLKNIAGGEDAEYTSKSSYNVSLEQLYIWDPDVILTQSVGSKGYILEDSKWQGLESVINDRVYNLPIGISRWGHVSSMEIPLACMWAGVNLYPEIFEDIDIKEEVRYFYSEFFDADLDDDTIEKILDGEEMRNDN